MVYMCTPATESKSKPNIVQGCTEVLLKLKLNSIGFGESWKIVFLLASTPLKSYPVFQMFSLWPPSEENCVHV